MPFRLMFASPVVLAAFTVIAIGVITYQIISKQKKKYPTSTYSRNRNDGPDDGSTGKPSCFKPDNDSIEKKNNSSTICRQRCVSKRHDGSVGPENPSNGPKEQNPLDDRHRRQRNSVNNPSGEFKPDYGNTQKTDNAPSRCDDTEWFENLLSSRNGNIVGNTEEKNDKVTNVKGNINRNDMKMPDYVWNIDDEDSDSSESNDSLNSTETNVTSASTEGAQCSNVDIQRSKCCSFMKDKDSRYTSALDSKDEVYKRAVHDYLKILGESKNNSDNEDTDCLESFSASSNNNINSTAVSKTPVMCKGCEEALPNAVAYPCKHCYLCLDCAIKVHRIYKKCSICNSVIKTYESLKMKM